MGAVIDGGRAGAARECTGSSLPGSGFLRRADTMRVNSAVDPVKG
jgi:hypothetical protein